MTPETPPPATAGLAEAQEPKRTSITWQLLQIAVLAGLLLAGMYEVDLDAKALAERRGRKTLLCRRFEALRHQYPRVGAGHRGLRKGMRRVCDVHTVRGDDPVDSRREEDPSRKRPLQGGNLRKVEF